MDASGRCEALRLSLNAAGVGVEVEPATEVAASLLRTTEFDVLLVGEPEDAGAVTFLRRLRMAKIDLPAMLLLGEDAGLTDRLEAFNAGADDVVGVGCPRQEVAARVGAIARRFRGLAQPVLSAGPVTLDLTARVVRVCGRPVHLSGREFQLLELLMLRKGATLSKAAIMDRIYAGSPDEPDMKIVDVFVCKIRRKLADAAALAGASPPSAGRLIKTIWGHGYQIDASAPQARAA